MNVRGRLASGQCGARLDAGNGRERDGSALHMDVGIGLARGGRRLFWSEPVGLGGRDGSCSIARCRKLMCVGAGVDAVVARITDLFECGG